MASCSTYSLSFGRSDNSHASFVVCLKTNFYFQLKICFSGVVFFILFFCFAVLKFKQVSGFVSFDVTIVIFWSESLFLG